MILKKYEADRFAGTGGVSVDLNGGLNVILGDNESGKSTMIEGIFRALTTSVYLDKRSDKDFLNSFFPTDGGNVIDSLLVFEEGGREYTLSKTWVSGKKGQSVSLKENGGKKMIEEEAEAWLRELLKYGKGIYSSVIFGRQSNEAEILEWLYAFLDSDTDDDRGEAKNIISQALSAAGGISIDRLGEMLDEEIESRVSNWDLERGVPVRKGAKKNLGTIYQRYIELSEAREAAGQARDSIAGLENCRKSLSENKEKRIRLKKELDEYTAKRAEAETRAAKVELAAKEAQRFEACGKALAAWTEAEKNLSAAKPLLAAQTEIEKRKRRGELLAVVAEIKKLSAEIEADEREIGELEGISEDCKKSVKLEKNIGRNKLTLSAGELTARVKMIDPHTAEIVHAEGSETVSGTAEIAAKGFVSVNIPGAAEIVIAPKNVDVAEIRAAIDADEKALSEILGRYAANSPEELEALQNKYNEKLRRIESGRLRLESRLGGRELSALEDELSGIEVSDENIPENYEREAALLLKSLGVKTLDDCVKRCELQIENYAEQYGSADSLRAELEKHSGAKAMLEELENDDALSPEELAKKINELNALIEEAQEETDELQRRLGSLEGADDIDLSELEEAVSAAEKAFGREKRECLIYRRIRDDLNALKESSGDNFSGFYDKFNEYLSEISGGRLSFPEGSALQSGTNLLGGSALLSEGTKKTVTLAFRLAVLHFFYPDGGALIVLDDPLIDMDPKRRGRSAKLLKKFAENNQVIITTCDPSIAELLADEPTGRLGNREQR